jgi:hypothetical protein
MNSKNGVPALEIVQLEMHLAFADLVAESFETAVDKALAKVGGRAILTLRLDEDPNYQRVTGVVVGEAHVALVFLTRDGQSVVVEAAEHSRHPMAEIALSRAAEGDLRQQTVPRTGQYFSRILRRN